MSDPSSRDRATVPQGSITPDTCRRSIADDQGVRHLPFRAFVSLCLCVKPFRDFFEICATCINE